MHDLTRRLSPLGGNELRPVVAHAIHGATHPESLELRARLDVQEGLRMERVSLSLIQPGVPVRPTHHHRHAIVQCSQRILGLCRDDGTGHQPGSFRHPRVLPELIDPGHGHAFTVDTSDEPGLLDRLPGTGRRQRLPFVEAIRRDEAPARGERLAKGGFRRDGLRSCVDQAGSAPSVLRPRGTSPQRIVARMRDCAALSRFVR